VARFQHSRFVHLDCSGSLHHSLFLARKESGT